jgi:hypothetical protein
MAASTAYPSRAAVRAVRSERAADAVAIEADVVVNPNTNDNDDDDDDDDDDDSNDVEDDANA